MKPCSICKTSFNQMNSMQSVCSPKCAIELVRNKEKKAARSNLLARKKALKTLGEHKKDLQAIFNKFIRLRDKNEPCISCQRHHSGQYHAGHYLSVGARPNLRYEENNVHKQCAPCNNHLSGNPINYRINLVKTLGVDVVDALEQDHEPKHYTIDDIEQMKKQYRAQIRALDKAVA